MWRGSNDWRRAHHDDPTEAGPPPCGSGQEGRLSAAVLRRQPLIQDSLRHKLILMATYAAGAGTALDDLGRVRARTRQFRSGHWFASLVFGVVILGALPFYVQSTPARMGTHCHSGGDAVLVCTGAITAGSPLLGRAFEAEPFSSLGSWSTLYWATAFLVGLAAVVAYYRLRARKVGVQGRLWPALVAGLVLLGLAMGVNDNSGARPGDFFVRGTSVLVVIALGLLVLATLERSAPFVVFSAGFFGLALLCCLYDVENLFLRLGIGGPFRGADNGLANLVLPGAYLVIGGLLFRIVRGWRLHVHAQLVRTPS